MFQEFDENDKSEEFLSDFRNKINQQSTNSFNEKKEEINRSKNILVGALSGVVLAAVVGFVAFFPKYDASEQAELPVIKRPQKAVKIQPLEPGGMKIENQDKSIYDIIEKKVDDTSKSVESILPPPEELKAIDVKEEVAVDDIIKEAEAKKEEMVKKVAVISEPKPVEVPKVAPVVEKIEIKKQEKTAEVKKEVIESAKAFAPVAKKIEAPKEVAKTSAKSTSVVAKGMWQVQIMSSKNEEAIKNAKKSLPAKYADLKNNVIEIESAYIAGKGTFYRLKAGSFKTKAEADKLCAALKAKGLSCFSKKK